MKREELIRLVTSVCGTTDAADIRWLEERIAASEIGDRAIARGCRSAQPSPGSSRVYPSDVYRAIRAAHLADKRLVVPDHRSGATPHDQALERVREIRRSLERRGG